MKRRRAGSGSAGFTLLEVIVALAVLSIAIVAAIQGFAQGLRLLKLSGDHQQAILLADEIMNKPLPERPGREEGQDHDFTWERTVKLVDTPDLVVAGTPQAWRAFEVTVRVRWGDRRQVELVTLRTVPLNDEKRKDT